MGTKTKIHCKLLKNESFLGGLVLFHFECVFLIAGLLLFGLVFLDSKYKIRIV